MWLRVFREFGSHCKVYGYTCTYMKTEFLNIFICIWYFFQIYYVSEIPGLLPRFGSNGVVSLAVDFSGNIYISTRAILCHSCDSFYLSKLSKMRPVYHETEALQSASKSLSACSRWCFDEPSCMLLSWTPGACWQVGYCGTVNVTGAVYGLKKDLIGGYLGFVSHNI